MYENNFLSNELLFYVSAVQHERAPRNYSKKPSYFPDLSAMAVGAAAAAAATGHFGSTSSVRPPLINPLVAPSMHHPYYGSFPLHHFKSVFPALFPPPSAFYSPTTSTAASAFSSVTATQNPATNIEDEVLESPTNDSSSSIEQEKKEDSEDEEVRNVFIKLSLKSNYHFWPFRLRMKPQKMKAIKRKRNWKLKTRRRCQKSRLQRREAWPLNIGPRPL